MKLFLTIICGSLALYLQAAPFVTPQMMKRNGLTDEQYEKLWSMGKRPRIDVGAARQWMYRANRYSNVTNWLNTIGKTNNFAALAARVPVLTEENETLVATNAVLVKLKKKWKDLSESWYMTATNFQAVAEANEADATAMREIRKSVKKSEKNISKVISTIEKAKKKAESDEELVLYELLLSIIKEEL